jgi:acetate kinase
MKNGPGRAPEALGAGDYGSVLVLNSGSSSVKFALVQHGRASGGRISLDGPVLAMIVPTDEELMIACDTARLIAGGADRPGRHR